MKKFKVIKQHYDLVEGTVVIDDGISETDTNLYGTEHHAVLIDGADIPITYIVPLDKLEEIQ
jgi:hypothetical protein